MNPASPIIARAGFGAAVLGTAAGLAEILIGTSPWLGNKNDPTTLGLITVLLAFVIGAAGWASSRATTTPRALAVAASMLLPALLGITTAGSGWLPAAAIGIVGGAGALRHSAQLGSIPHALGEQWPTILLGCLALIYIALGVAARGFTGVLAVLGGLAVLTAPTLCSTSRTAAAVMLLAGSIPFAAVAWWSVVPPMTATLILLVGLPLVLSPRSPRLSNPNTDATPTKRLSPATP
jgi:hypothetical protein